MTKSLLILGAGWQQVSTIRAAQRNGLRVIAVDRDSRCPGFVHADATLSADISQPDQVCAALVSSGSVVDGVISAVSDAGMMSAAVIREQFRLPGPDAATTEHLTIKSTQRTVLQKAGITVPKWCTESHQTAGYLRFPVIVKPADGAGSRGISIADDEASLAVACHHARLESRRNSIIIEEFICGSEYSVEGFSVEGRYASLAISRREVRNCKSAHAIVTDDALSGHDRTQIIATVADSLRAIGYTDGPSHVEVMVTGTGDIYLIEAAGRGGGFGVYETLVPWHSGFDAAAATCLQAVGCPIRVEARPQNEVSLLFLSARNPGTFRGTAGTIPLSGKNYRISLLKRPGDSVRQHDCDSDRVGIIATKGKTSHDALEYATHLAAALDVRIQTTADSAD